MIKRKRLAPLQEKQHGNNTEDVSNLAYDILNDVFGNFTSSHSTSDVIDLDDWKTSPKLEPDLLEISGKCESEKIGVRDKRELIGIINVNSSSGLKLTNRFPVSSSASDTEAFRPSPKELQSSRNATENERATTPSNSTAWNKAIKPMFTSREQEEDSVILMKFSKRLVPSSTLKELKSNMEFVPLASALKSTDKRGWFTAGVVTENSKFKTSTGARIDVCDLAAQPYTVRILLFKSAFSQSKQLTVGSIICITNPSKGKPFKGYESLVANDEDQILLAGTSMDYGLCGASKKRGGHCQQVVNLSICRYCSFHALSEYKKTNHRKDPRGVKVDSLNSFSSQSAMKISSTASTNIAKSNISRKLKDNSILNKLSAQPAKSDVAKSTAPIEKASVSVPSIASKCPMSEFMGQGLFERNQHGMSPKTTLSAAKKRALEYAKQTGGIHPANKRSKPSPLEVEKPKGEIITKEFIALMTAKPSNPALLAEVEAEERDKKFDKLKLVEEVSEKLSSTHEIPVRLIRCLACAKNFHKLPLECTEKGHKCRIVKGTKRFFECTNCRNRTSTIERLPVTECAKCGRSNWRRAGMAAEKICTNLNPLSVRGLEEKFLGSVATETSISLLVPDDK